MRPLLAGRQPERQNFLRKSDRGSRRPERRLRLAAAAAGSELCVGAYFADFSAPQHYQGNLAHHVDQLVHQDAEGKPGSSFPDGFRPGLVRYACGEMSGCHELEFLWQAV